jgi:hypothetical protein
MYLHCREFRVIFAGLIFLSLSAECGFGQATSGSILGRIADSTDAVVVDAEVIARNENTGLTQRSKTDSEGYLLRNLPPGPYTLTVSKAGFKTVTQSDVLLVVDQKLRLDFVLAPGSTNENVTVTGEAPLLQTQTVETGDVIQSRQILDLPLNGRNFLQLARLTPGVIGGAGGNSSNLAVNGQREFANSIMIDGVETTSNRNNDNSLSPSVDAVEQFKVVTSAYSAEFGRAAGAVVSIQTKSGSNGYHGSVYEFFRPNNTAALPYSFGGTDLPSALKHHNFGVTIGGPIKKDKLFFFASFEGFRLRNQFPFLDAVPPSGQINYLPNGDVDLSGMLDPNTGNQIPIFDPQAYADAYAASDYSYADAVPFPGNIIPADRVSQAGKAILQNFFPAPNLPGDGNGWFANYAGRQSYSDNTNNVDARVDFNLSEHDRISGVYHYGDLDEGLGDRFAGDIAIAGGGTTDSSIQNNSMDQSMSIVETHIFSQNWLNELRVGYSRFRLDETDLLNGSNAADQFGLGNINLPGFPATQGFPQLFLGSGYSTGGSTYLPLFFRDNNLQITDSVSAKIGKHDIKFGADYRRLRANPNFTLFPTGYQYYNGQFASLTSDPNFICCGDPEAFFGSGGSDIADLLLGLPAQVFIGLQLNNPTTKSWETGLYFQDSWQLTPKLVLDYGLRYEYQAPYTAVDDQAANFDPTTLSFLVAGRGGNSSSLINPDKNNFGPRLGLSYRVGAKTVIRAGYGVYFSPENDARSDVFTKNYPFNVQKFYFSSAGFLDYQLDAGKTRETTIPAIPDNGIIAAADIPDGNIQSFFYVDPHLRTGYSQLYNLTIQRELLTNLSIEVGYVGSGGRKLPYSVGDINKVDAATSQRRITGLLGQISGQFPIGLSSYNSLQAKLTRRFSSGLSFQGSYTYGKGIDNGPAPFNLGKGINSHNQPQDPFNIEAERAVSDNDITHNLVFNAIYELPIGKGKRFFGGWSGAKQSILGGWQLNSIAEAHTGRPVNIIQNGQNNIDPGLRPNLVGDPVLDRDERTLTRYFNTSAFCVPTAGTPDCPDLGPNGIGNSPRNPVRGPGFVNTDLSLFKEFSFSETRKFQFRFEFFNLFNTPHFANPGSDFKDRGSFGIIRGTNGDQRQIQFALKFLF